MRTLPSLRETTFEIPSIIDETETFTIKTDGNVKLASTLSTSLAGPDGALMTETTTQAQDGTITLVRHIVLPKKTYTVAEYPAVRKMITTWLSPTHQKLLFVKR